MAQAYKDTSDAYYIEPEFMIGKVVPNGSFYPEHNDQRSYFLNIGKSHDHAEKPWAAFYNYPETGVSLSVSRFRHDSIFGRSYAVIPYLVLRTGRQHHHSLNFKLGLGGAYFTRYYDQQQNESNKAIGSSINWAFQAFAYYHFVVRQNMMLKIGGGYLHSSNGHTQLPNYGLNSAMLSVAAQYNFSPIRGDYSPTSPTSTDALSQPGRQYFMEYRAGYGFHEFGGTSGPVGGPKKGVYTLSVAGGLISRQFVKYKAGFAYRFYQHYYDYINAAQVAGFKDNPLSSASNIYFFLGSEFLIGHFGLDIEGGLNLYKPFYQSFNDMFEHKENFRFWLKKLFPCRMGLKYYVIDPVKNPAGNLFLAANINANFGGADFTEFSIGFCRSVR